MPCIGPSRLMWKHFTGWASAVAGLAAEPLLPWLLSNTTYFFRIWTKDDFGLYSGLSQGATQATLAAQPGTLANPFTGVFLTSVTVSWLAGE